MKKKHEVIRVKAMEYINKWSYMITHYGWRFDILWVESRKNLTKKQRKEHGKNVAAFVKTRPDYLSGEIYIMLPMLEGMTDEEIEHVVVHELTHFLISPFQNNYSLLEYTTETITRILMGLNK